MGHHLHTTGEEFMQKQVFREDLLTNPGEITVGLHLDDSGEGGDDLADGDNVGDVTTEPTGSNYNRQTASFESADFDPEENADGNWQVIVDDLTFDTDDSDEDIDSYFIVVDFNADSGVDGDNLFWSGPLDQLYDLTHVDEFVLQGAGLELD